MQRRSREHRDPSEGDLEAGGRKRIGENRSIGIREIMIGRRYLQNWRQRRARSLRESDGPESVLEKTSELPTYQLLPKVKPAYDVYKVMINDFLQEKLKNAEYESEACLQILKELPDDVMKKLKAKSWPARYKCVINVMLGQKVGQGIQISSLCAWDAASDNYTTCSYQNSSLYCVVTIFGIYHE